MKTLAQKFCDKHAERWMFAADNDEQVLSELYSNSLYYNIVDNNEEFTLDDGSIVYFNAIGLMYSK